MLNKDDHIDHQRWLIENGFINDLHKDNLYMYGALCHKDILAVELRINIEEKTVEYDLYMPKSLLKKINKYNKLRLGVGIIDLWRLKRLLKREGSLDFNSMLWNFVRDYLGPKWKVKSNNYDIESYEDGFEQETKVSDVVDKPANSE